MTGVNDEIGTRYLSCYGSCSFIFTPSDIFSAGCSFVIETINISEVSSGRCQSNSGIQRHDSSARASLGRSMIDAADGRGRRKVPSSFHRFSQAPTARGAAAVTEGDGGPPTEQQNMIVMFRLLRCRTIVLVSIRRIRGGQGWDII